MVRSCIFNSTQGTHQKDRKESMASDSELHFRSPSWFPSTTHARFYNRSEDGNPSQLHRLQRAATGIVPYDPYQSQRSEVQAITFPIQGMWMLRQYSDTWSHAKGMSRTRTQLTAFKNSSHPPLSTSEAIYLYIEGADSGVTQPSSNRITPTY